MSALHLSDDAIDVLKAGKFNPRLLSEILCHHDFQKMMLDAEIYVDRIADMRINDMNAVLQAVRQMVLMQQEEKQNDLYLRTLELAQVQEDEYFGHVISDDLKLIHNIYIYSSTSIEIVWKCGDEYQRLLADTAKKEAVEHEQG